MPTNLKCPYIAEWPEISEEGRFLDKSIGPEDVLPFLMKGMTFWEISKEMNAPLKVVTHVIACIPDMMKWRDLVVGGPPCPDEEVDILRGLQQEYLPNNEHCGEEE